METPVLPRSLATTRSSLVETRLSHPNEPGSHSWKPRLPHLGDKRYLPRKPRLSHSNEPGSHVETRLADPVGRPGSQGGNPVIAIEPGCGLRHPRRLPGIRPRTLGYRTIMRQNGYCNPGDGVVLTSSKRDLSHHHATKRLPQSPAIARCSRTENPFVASPSDRTPTAPMAMVRCSSAANPVSRTTKRQNVPSLMETFCCTPRETFSPFVESCGQVFRSDIHPCTLPPHEGRPGIHVSSHPTS